MGLRWKGTSWMGLKWKGTSWMGPLGRTLQITSLVKNKLPPHLLGSWVASGEAEGKVLPIIAISFLQWSFSPQCAFTCVFKLVANYCQFVPTLETCFAQCSTFSEMAEWIIFASFWQFVTVFDNLWQFLTASLKEILLPTGVCADYFIVDIICVWSRVEYEGNIND